MSPPLFDNYGTPLYAHPRCLEPECGADEIGSAFDDAWCCACGWSGSLFELRKRASESGARFEKGPQP